MEYALRTYDLTKTYGKRNVVNSVNMNIKKGDVYGFVGKNGAGKTTLIRVVLGLAKPSGGSYEFFGGEDPIEARKRVGNLIESPAIYPRMTATENLTVYCKMLGISTEKIGEILSLVGLADTGKKKAMDFSLGMKQRLGIAIALIGDPEFLILDEPINGLDPSGIMHVRDLIISLSKDYGKTILISSHILGELSKIATCYGIINSGNLVEEISAEQLKEICRSSVNVKTDNPQKAKEIISNLLNSQKIDILADGTISIHEKVEDNGVLSKALFENGVVVSGISQTEDDMEKYFINKMGG